MTGVKPLDTWLQMWLRRLRLAFCAQVEGILMKAKKKKFSWSGSGAPIQRLKYGFAIAGS